MEKKLRQQALEELLQERRKSIEAIKNRPCSLFVRHLDCGSCNACELELNALANPIFDIAGLGIQFDASPRHADILVLTGPYVRGLDVAALSTLEAMPVPRVVTVGDCTEGNSEFQNSYATIPFPDAIKNAIVAHVSGCPPTPDQILTALLAVGQDLLRF